MTGSWPGACYASLNLAAGGHVGSHFDDSSERRTAATGDVVRIAYQVNIVTRSEPDPRLPAMTSERQREVAARIREDQRFWRALVDEVGRDRMDEPGTIGTWSFRDTVAHLVAWRNMRIPAIEAAARGLPERPKPWPAHLANDDYDRINEWFENRDRDRPLDDVLADYDRSFERLAQAVEALPESIAHDPNGMAWTGGEAVIDLDFTEHLHEEHLPDIRAWLDQKR